MPRTQRPALTRGCQWWLGQKAGVAGIGQGVEPVFRELQDSSGRCRALCRRRKAVAVTLTHGPANCLPSPDLPSGACCCLLCRRTSTRE